MSNTLDSALCRQARSIPTLLEQQYADLEPKARLALTTEEIFAVQRIVLTGCGDSLAAGMAAKYAFEGLTGIPTEVVPAIELSRFYDPKQLGFSPYNPLVIAVSNSGGVARVAEAVGRCTNRGALTLAVTGSPDAALGRSAQKVMKLDIPPFESAPGTRSYLVSVLSLLLLAIRFGEVRGRYTMDTAMAYRGAIPVLAQALGEGMEALDADCRALALAWKDCTAYDFVAAGADYAAAWFGHAKVFEALGRPAMHINTEEWLHLNFFQRAVDSTATVAVCAGDSPARSRMVELLGYAVQMGRPLALVTDAPEAFPAGAALLPVPRAQYPFLAPLVQFVPMSLLCGCLCELLGEEDGRGCKGPWSFCQGGAAIKNSEIVLL